MGGWFVMVDVGVLWCSSEVGVVMMVVFLFMYFCLGYILCGFWILCFFFVVWSWFWLWLLMFLLMYIGRWVLCLMLICWMFGRRICWILMVMWLVWNIRVLLMCWWMRWSSWFGDEFSFLWSVFRKWIGLLLVCWCGILVICISLSNWLILLVSGICCLCLMVLFMVCCWRFCVYWLFMCVGRVRWLVWDVWVILVLGIRLIILNFGWSLLVWMRLKVWLLNICGMWECMKVLNVCKCVWLWWLLIFEWGICWCDGCVDVVVVVFVYV